MSNDTIIKVENLGKRYRIGAHEGYKTFRETLVDAAKAPFVRLGGATRGTQSAKRSKPDSLPLALCSLLSSQGEVIGIIGRNDAGNNTLLKILSQITKATGGKYMHLAFATAAYLESDILLMDDILTKRN